MEEMSFNLSKRESVCEGLDRSFNLPKCIKITIDNHQNQEGPVLPNGYVLWVVQPPATS